MDTVTHGILGALTVRCLPGFRDSPDHPDHFPKITSREVTSVACVAAMFPDIDYVLFWLHPLQFLAEWHRAATHSFVMLPLWSILIGFTAALLTKARWKWRAYTFICVIGMSTHIIADMITVYGTQIFNPLSDYKAVIGTTFFIDGYFTAIVLLGLMGSSVLKHYQNTFQKYFALIAIGVLLSYLGLQGYFRSLANNVAEQYVTHHHLQQSAISVLPQPFSPTYWKIIIDSNNGYHVSYIDVMPVTWHQQFTLFMVKLFTANSANMSRAVNSYTPLDAMVWNRYQKINSEDRQIVTAWNQETLSAFRDFAVFPVLYRVDNVGNDLCVWFTELRYVFPVMTPPFRYGVCKQREQWALYRLERNSLNSRQRID